jgi:hypothetical protein
VSERWVGFRGRVEDLQKLPALVRGFFTDPHLKYVTA